MKLAGDKQAKGSHWHAKGIELWNYLPQGFTEAKILYGLQCQ